MRREKYRAHRGCGRFNRLTPRRIVLMEARYVAECSAAVDAVRRRRRRLLEVNAERHQPTWSRRLKRVVCAALHRSRASLCIR